MPSILQRGAVADIAVESEFQRRCREAKLQSGPLALEGGHEVVEAQRGIDRLVMPDEAPGCGEVLEIDGQASANSTFVNVSTIL